MRKWLLVGCGVLVSLLVVACMGIVLWLFRSPKIELPVREYPPNNAYEEYRKIAAQMQTQFAGDMRFYQIEDALTNSQSLSAADRAYYLQRMEPFLRAYAPLTTQESKAVFEYDPNWLMPELAQMRRIARAEAFLIRESLRQKRYADALTRIERLNRFADQVRAEGFLIHYLVGVAINMVALAPLRETLPSLQDRAALERIVKLAQQHEARRVPLWKAMVEERYITLSMYDKLARGEADISSLTDPDARPRFGKLMRPLVNLALPEYRRMMGRAIEELQKPFHQRDKKVINQEPRQLLNKILYPVYARSSDKEAAEVAIVRLIGCTAAVRLYKLRTGKYPESLEALGLGEMIIDPFSGAPFRYQMDPKRGFLLYSVGENRKDDGGAVPYGGASEPRGDLSAVSVRTPDPLRGTKRAPDPLRGTKRAPDPLRGTNRSHRPLASPVWLK